MIMKFYSVLLMTMIVGNAGVWAAKCVANAGYVCPGCGAHPPPPYTSKNAPNCPTKDVKVVVVCNAFQCNCQRCEPGCSSCQAAHGFGGALAPPANTTATADPCSSADEFIAMTVPELMAVLNAVYCASASDSVGFKFLGYILNLVDTNKDGVISCAEYNADQLSNNDFIKKKPACPLSPDVKLKNAHTHA